MKDYPSPPGSTFRAARVGSAGRIDSADLRHWVRMEKIGRTSHRFGVGLVGLWPGLDPGRLPLLTLTSHLNRPSSRDSVPEPKIYIAQQYIVCNLIAYAHRVGYMGTDHGAS